MELAKHSAQLPADTNNLSTLASINAYTHGALKRLCYIFLRGDSLGFEELKSLRLAATINPLMPSTVLSLYKKGFYSINELKHIALNPQKGIQHSLLHHFAKEFAQFSLNHYLLYGLKLEELQAVRHCFLLLQNTGCSTPQYYKHLLKNDEKSKLLYLLLPRIAVIKDLDYRRELIDILFQGVLQGPVMQGKTIATIKNAKLTSMATTLHQQCICTKVLQRLNFEQEVMHLAVINDIQGKRFRQIILDVETQCKKIHERLSKVSHNHSQVNQWQVANEHYRKDVYTAVFAALKQRAIDLPKTLQEAQDKVLAIIDPQERSKIKQLLVRLANALIYILTCGLAHKDKTQRTGNPSFFTQTTSGEEIRALGGRMLDEVCPYSSEIKSVEKF